jgi:hypothetical protein
MRKDKRTRLEVRGWKFGTAKDFLHLSEEESAYIELKIRRDRNIVSLPARKSSANHP